mgnify:CR=1 FL=1
MRRLGLALLLTVTATAMAEVQVQVQVREAKMRLPPGNLPAAGYFSPTAAVRQWCRRERAALTSPR